MPLPALPATDSCASTAATSGHLCYDKSQNVIYGPVDDFKNLVFKAQSNTYAVYAPTYNTTTKIGFKYVITSFASNGTDTSGTLTLYNMNNNPGKPDTKIYSRSIVINYKTMTAWEKAKPSTESVTTPTGEAAAIANKEELTKQDISLEKAKAPFKSYFCGSLTDTAPKECANYPEWIKGVWKFTMFIVGPLSVLILAAAGFVWMTSTGNPDRISLAKKLILGVFSGLLLLILARVLLINIIGLDSSIWNL